MNESNPTQIFKLLSDETRLRIVLLIQAAGELCVCELTEALSLSQPKISRHLAHLKSGALLADRRDGQWVYYRLHPDMSESVNDILERIFLHYRELPLFVSDNARYQASKSGLTCDPCKEKESEPVKDTNNSDLLEETVLANS